MAAQKGKDLLLKAADGAGTFATVAGLRARQIAFNAEIVDVTRDAAGQPVPNHFRERFKIRGPSVRPDLGKQAEFGVRN